MILAKAISLRSTLETSLVQLFHLTGFDLLRVIDINLVNIIVLANANVWPPLWQFSLDSSQMTRFAHQERDTAPAPY